MKKRILSLLLAAVSAFSLSLPALAVEPDVADTYDDLDEYDQYTISFKHSVMRVMDADTFQDDIDAAKSYVESLNLEEQNLGYISEACLAQLDELAFVPDCVLNEYTVLVPKTRAATPTYYGTESGVDFYSTLTSRADYQVKKMSATGSNLTRWVKSVVDLVMTFLDVPELTIPWSVVNGIASSNYEVYKDDIVEAWAALSPVTRTIYVKEGTSFKAITNSEFGEVNPYLSYHLCNVNNPTGTKYLGRRTLPESSKSSQLDVAIYAYNHGGTLLNDQLHYHIDFVWS